MYRNVYEKRATNVSRINYPLAIFTPELNQEISVKNYQQNVLLDAIFFEQ